MELEILEKVGSLGVGCVLGLVIFFMYRRDRKCTESRLTSLIEQDQKTREANTKALTELNTFLVRVNGHSK